MSVTFLYEVAADSVITLDVASGAAAPNFVFDLNQLSSPVQKGGSKKRETGGEDDDSGVCLLPRFRY